MPLHSTTVRRHLVAIVAAAIGSGAIWMAVVPPFEGPDELYFYNRARDYAVHPQRREPLFFRLATPIVRGLASSDVMATPIYSPGFQFISNAHGEVNRFVHERTVARPEHLRTLFALRGLVVLLSALTLVAIYAMAALALGSENAALGVAGICLFIPQYSFMNAVVHPEVVTRLLGATVSLLVVARATGRLSRVAAWSALLLLLALVPLADRQAFFLVPFGLLAVVMTERGWRRRAATAAAFLLPGLVATWFVVRYVEEGTGQWLALIRHPLGVLVDPDPGRGSTPPELAYYVYEFVPKLFMGFWGWLGQPSVLLPAWLYAAFGIVVAASAAGLVARAVRTVTVRVPDDSDGERDRVRARRLLAAGIGIMLVPIVYAPALAGRNLWYGRWLFAMLGPIAIGFWLGLAEMIGVARRRPHAMAAVVATLAALAGAWWVSALGDTFRAGVLGNHYGDRARLIETARDTVLALAVCAAAVELWPRIPAWRTRWSSGAATCALAGVLNITLLLTFVGPLYAPMSAADYVGSITRAVAEDNLERAAALYATAVKSYPASVEVRELADRTPRLLLGTSLDEMSGILQNRIAQGKGLADRDLLTALAPVLPAVEWSRSSALRSALADAARRPDLKEPAMLVGLLLDGRATDRTAAAELIEAGHGVLLRTAMHNGAVVLEGFTLWPRPTGTQVTVYFRPETGWDNRHLWLHAYSPGSTTYLDPAPISGRPLIVPHELAWAVFRLPPGQFQLFFGVAVGNDLGAGSALGMIP